MFKYKLRKLIGEKAASEDRAISLTEIARATGVNRVTLSKMANNRPYNASLEVVGQLCSYFGCRIEDVVEYVAESAVSSMASRTATRPARKGGYPDKRKRQAARHRAS